MKKVFLFCFIISAVLIFINDLSADLRTVTICRPEYPGYCEEFQEVNVVGNINLKNDYPDFKIGKVYESTHHRVCLDGVDIGITYHEIILAGPQPDTYTIQVRLGPKPGEKTANLKPGIGDVDRNGKVDEQDLLFIMVSIAKNPKDVLADINRDSKVDKDDLAVVYAQFGQITWPVKPQGELSTAWGKIKDGTR